MCEQIEKNNKIENWKLSSWIDKRQQQQNLQNKQNNECFFIGQQQKEKMCSMRWLRNKLWTAFVKKIIIFVFWIDFVF